MSSDWGVTANGYNLPTFSAIYDEIGSGYRVTFNAAGIEIDTQDEPINQIISVTSDRNYELWLKLQAPYDAQSVDNATGKALSNMAFSMAKRRMGPTNSICNIVLTAKSTTGFSSAIGDLVANINTGELWEATEVIVVLAGASETVAFRSVDVGSISATIGLLTDIKSSKSGWDSATNVVDATLGQPYESDSALRLRLVSDMSPKELDNQLLSYVTGVTQVSVYQNDTGGIDAQGRPNGAVEAVVVGGDDTDIGNMVLKIKADGVQTWGNDSVIVQDSNQDSKTVYFSRVDEIAYWINVKLRVGDNFNLGTKQEVKVTINSGAVGDYVIKVNGNEFTETVAAPTTEIAIASALSVLINAVPYQPVTAVYNSGDDYFMLVADYAGVPFTYERRGSISLSESVGNSGDQTTVIQRIVDFSDTYQTIGGEVYLDKYIAAVFNSDDDINLQIYGADVFANIDGGAFVGPATGASDLIMSYAELATLDSVRVTVEIV